MAIDTFGIPLAYLIVIAAAMWIVFGVRGRWWLKAGVVCVTVAFSAALWHSLPSLQGWPVEEEMPERFEIKWLITREPGKQGRSPGAVYVWAVDLDPGRAAGKPFFLQLRRRGRGPEPRIYRLPYSRPLHEQAREIQDKIMGGGRFFGFMEKGLPGEGGVPGEGAGREGRAGGEPLGERKGSEAGRGAPYAVHQDYIFHELPPPRFPEKGQP